MGVWHFLPRPASGAGLTAGWQNTFGMRGYTHRQAPWLPAIHRKKPVYFNALNTREISINSRVRARAAMACRPLVVSGEYWCGCFLHV